jgi:hypothetical protein
VYTDLNEWKVAADKATAYLSTDVSIMIWSIVDIESVCTVIISFYNINNIDLTITPNNTAVATSGAGKLIEKSNTI